MTSIMIYKVRGPDGRVYEVKGPNGATAEQLGAFLTENMSNQQVKAAAQNLVDRDAVNPAKSGSDFNNARAGFGKAIVDLARGVGQNFGLVSREDVKESRQLDAPLMDTKAGKVGNFAGNVTVAAPLALAPGANTILGAAAYGGGMGLLQPSASTDETMKNVTLGAAGGAAVPAVVTGLRVGRAAIDPLYQGGRDRIIGTALNEASGGQGAQAAARLRASTQIVPGSAPTAGQAAGNPGIAALERTATQTDPVAMNLMAARREAQNDARLNFLQTITPDRAAAQHARDAAANALYGQANGRQVTQTPQLAALLQRPSAQNAIARARNLAAESGQAFDDAALTGLDAHRIKMGLDDVVNMAPQTGIGGNELRAIQGTRADFLGELERQIPEYGQARQAYAAGSRPINQADVITEIGRRGTNFRGNLTPAAYVRALSDRTAQQVTGRPAATLADVLDPGQLASLNNVGTDLLSLDFANTAGKGVRSDTVQKLASSHLLAKSGMPNWLKDFPGGGVVGRATDFAYKNSNDQMRQQLAQALLDPQETARLIEAGIVSPQTQALIENLRRGGAALGASAPGLVQANQQ